MSYTPTEWEPTDVVTATRMNALEQAVGDMNMSYTPNTWSDGDILSAEKMNALEQAVASGGGGSSDFSTAEVTVIGYDGVEGFSVDGIPKLMSDRLDSSPIYQNNNSETYTIPLYKGKTLFTMAWMEAISSTGNVSYDEELECYVATGNGTITVRPID